MADNEILQLRAGPIDVGLVPAIGGSVSHFRHGGIDLMRSLSDENRTAGIVLGVAMFPMMPYANRVADNAFTFDGRSYRVEPNNPPEKFNVHGTGWQRSWSIAAQSETDVLLTLEVMDDSAAYAYRASQRFTVHDEGLSVEMTIGNAGPVAMPFGFGLHPWFERDPDTTLQFAATTFYLEEPGHLSGDPVGVPPEVDFGTARTLPGRWRNNDYGGWGGSATVGYPARGLGVRMRADPVFRHLMIYADRARTVFCVEPQTNASGAFNRPGGYTDTAEGVIVLRPGESASGCVHFDVLAL